MNQDIYILLLRTDFKYIESDARTTLEDVLVNNQYNPIPNEENRSECVLTIPNDKITTVSKCNPYL